jgi:DNA-binding LacI/PurR family transcriptional regulator
MTDLTLDRTANLAVPDCDAALPRADTVGILIPHHVPSVFNDPYFAPLIRGIAQGCHIHKYRMLLFLCHSELARKRFQDQLTGDGRVAGIIVVAARSDARLVAELMAEQLPVLILDRPANSAVEDIETRLHPLAKQSIQEMGRQAVAKLMEQLVTTTASPLSSRWPKMRISPHYQRSKQEIEMLERDIDDLVNQVV